QLIDTKAALVPCIAAFATADRLKDGPGLLVPRKICRHIVLGRLILLLAIRTQPANEPLSHDRFDGARDEEWLNAHIGHARKRAGGVVRVQRAKYQVAGERRLNRVFGSFQVADFADEHDVGVVTQNAAERMSERQADLGMDLNLIDPLELILDWVLRRD